MSRKPKTTELFVMALLARGYSECKVEDTEYFRCFAISPSHARRIDPHGSRVWIRLDIGNVALGTGYSGGKALPRATKRNLVAEGAELFLRTQQDLLKSLSQPISLEDLGL